MYSALAHSSIAGVVVSIGRVGFSTSVGSSAGASVSASVGSSVSVSVVFSDTHGSLDDRFRRGGLDRIAWTATAPPAHVEDIW